MFGITYLKYIDELTQQNSGHNNNKNIDWVLFFQYIFQYPYTLN